MKPVEPKIYEYSDIHFALYFVEKESFIYIIKMLYFKKNQDNHFNMVTIRIYTDEFFESNSLSISISYLSCKQR